MVKPIIGAHHFSPILAKEQVYYSDFLAATLDVRKQIRKAAVSIHTRGPAGNPHKAPTRHMAPGGGVSLVNENLKGVLNVDNL